MPQFRKFAWRNKLNPSKLFVVALATVVLGAVLTVPARAYAGPLADAGAAIMQFFGLDNGLADRSREDLISNSRVVDSNTMDSYKERLMQDIDGQKYLSTSNVGRIWTDKSVIASDVNVTEGNNITVPQTNAKDADGKDLGYKSDFMVALSAMSSTSNTLRQVAKPLDIGLVLETGGTLTGDREANMKTAAKAFVSEFASMGEGHRVAVISGKANAELVTNGYVDCVSNKTAINNAIDSLDSNNAVHIDSAYTLINDASKLPSAENAQRVVITLSTGGHSGSGKDDFNKSNAGKDIETAKVLKEKNTLIYNIGVYEGAVGTKNPSPADVDDIPTLRNCYFQALSSNYPSATCINPAAGDWMALGERNKNDNYYWPVDVSGTIDFDKVFGGIMTDIEANIGSAPTQVEEGVKPTDGGFVTFTDRLGNFMQVDDVAAIVYGGVKFDVRTVGTNAEGNTTYTFTGEVDSAISSEETVSLANIDITVKRARPSTDSTVAVDGDTIEVKIPASLIPMRRYTVSTAETGDDKTPTIEVDNTTPVRVVYGVSLRPGVAEMFAQPTKDTPQEILNYIQSHTAEDGKINFYSNWFDPNTTTELGSVGDTTVNYQPAQSNYFYRFIEDRPIYAANGTLLTSMDQLVEGESYYYQLPYWRAVETSAGGNGDPVSATEDTLKVSFTYLNDNDLSSYIIAKDGQLVFLAGAPRIARVNQNTYFGKSENTTGTAGLVANLHWFETEQPYTQIQSYMGNNGRLSIEVPGGLAVIKHAVIGEGLDHGLDAQKVWLAAKEFAFNITVTDAATAAADGVYAAQVWGADGHLIADGLNTVHIAGGKVYAGEAGADLVKLHSDETLYIYGLKSGLNFEVAEDEKSMPAGFEQTGAELNNVPSNGDSISIAGTIKAATLSQAEFENTYSAMPTEPAIELVKAQKQFKHWEHVPEGTQFTIRMTSTASPAGSKSLFPSEAKVQEDADGQLYITKQVANGDTFSFGEFSFDRPGVYSYSIAEEIPADKIPGVLYSSEKYKVSVTVVDDGEGQLKIADGGVKVTDHTGAVVKDSIAKITNGYDLQATNAKLSATKHFEDNSGALKLEGDMFTFGILPLTDGAPKPQYQVDGGKFEDFAALEKVEGAYKSTNYPDGRINLGALHFDSTMLEGSTSKTYIYKVWEVNAGKAGMSYDDNVYYAHVTVSWVNAGEKNEFLTSKVVWRTGEALNSSECNFGEGKTSPTFNNTFEARPVTDVRIQGAKILEGRDMLVGESFGFELMPHDEATKAAIANRSVVFGDGTDDGAAQSATAQVSWDGALDDDGKHRWFEFGPLSFNRAGTYEFVASETKWNGEDIPANPTNGITFSTHKCLVKVVVTLDGDQLVATVNYGEGANHVDGHEHLEFVNTYTVAQPQRFGGIYVSKTLSGRNMEDGEFNFTITPTSEAAHAKVLSTSDASFGNDDATASGKADYMLKLSDLNFYLADVNKKFVYELKEDLPSDDDSATEGIQKDGVTYDQTVYTITLIPHDNGNGTLSIEYKVEPPFKGETADGKPILPFKNTYTSDPVDFNTSDPDAAGINLTKELKGRDWTDADEFEFTLHAVTVDAPMPAASDRVTVNEDGTRTVKVSKADLAEGSTVAPFGFGTLEFDHAGLYIYTVAEAHQGETVNGVTYDAVPAGFAVRVNDNGKGQLEAVLAWSEFTDFVNTYAAAPVESSVSDGIDIKKTIAGRELAKDEFSFVLKKAGSNEVLQTVTNDAQGNIVFDAIEYTEPGEYAYTVSEVAGNAAGVTYDKTVYTVVVTVADNGQGQLVATSKIKGSEATSIEFKNVYSAQTSPDTEAGIVATKTMTGRPLKAGEFSFELKTLPAAGEGKVVETVTNAADGSIAFKRLSFDTKMLEQAIAEGYAVELDPVGGKPVYAVNYQVNEMSSQLPGGVSMTNRSYNVTVLVTDHGDGTLSTMVEYPDGMDGAVAFVNTYSAGDPIEMVFKGSKVLNVAEGLTAPDITGKFSFTIASNDGGPVPNPAKVTNDANGNVVFNAVEFTLDMLKDVAPAEDGSREKTFHYTVTESGSAEGVTNDSAITKEFSVTLHDNGEGQLDATWVESASHPEGDYFVFTNSYDVKPAESIVTDQLSISKVLEGRQLVEGEFTFELVEGNNVVATGTHDADGKVTFGGITYSKPGEHTYIVREVAGNATGVTYDEKTYVINTKVEDKGDGTLKVTHAIDGDAEAITFKNEYKASASSAQIEATKVLNGRELKEGEFSFVLKDEAGNELQTVKNNAEGKVTFAALDFDKAGTYTYTVSELVPEDDNAELDGIQKNGVTYDTHTLHVTVTVTDNGEGKLVAQVDYTGGAKFENTYAPAPIESSVTDGIAISKVLTGRDLKEGEFSFVLKDAEGKELTAANSADGKVEFGGITYTKAGTYEYTVNEVVPEDDDADAEGIQKNGVTYDETVYAIVVTVADNGDGTLSVNYALKDSDVMDVTFTNSYEKPEEPGTDPDPEPPVDPDPDPENPPVDPKPNPDPNKPDKPDKPGDTGNELPKTGDDSLLPIVGLGVAGVLAIVIGIVAILRRKK